jgi:hypothetical protein
MLRSFSMSLLAIMFMVLAQAISRLLLNFIMMLTVMSMVTVMTFMALVLFLYGAMNLLRPVLSFF